MLGYWPANRNTRMTEKRGLLCGYTLSEARLFYCLTVASSIDQFSLHLRLQKRYRSLHGRIENRPLCFRFILEQIRLKIKPDPMTGSIVKENESPGLSVYEAGFSSSRKNQSTKCGNKPSHFYYLSVHLLPILLCFGVTLPNGVILRDSFICDFRSGEVNGHYTRDRESHSSQMKRIPMSR